MNEGLAPGWKRNKTRPRRTKPELGEPDRKEGLGLEYLNLGLSVIGKEGVAHMVLCVDPSGQDGPGAPSTFSAEEIKDVSRLVGRLGKQSDPISDFLWKGLSRPDPATLTKYQPSAPSSTQAQDVVVQAFNKVVAEPCIYEAERFKGVSLRPETTEILKQSPTGPGLAHLNRFLLQDAYPLELSKKKGPFTKAFAGHTKEGIGIGSSRADVIHAYGEPTAKQAGGEGWPNFEVLRYRPLGLYFRLRDDRVDTIGVIFQTRK
jgi:hypothetical protein